ncbi:hypothetical protein HRbin30_02886 [bacterium HR30]|nr:hypothetical protein HRbin30_02886 [bacterium HR30]
MNDPEKLEERLQTLEDTFALHNLLTEYGFAADRGDAESLLSMFTADAVYELDELRIEGRDEIVATIIGQRDNPMMVASAHTIGPVVISVQGDRATARGYSRLYVLEDDDRVTLWRLSFNRWDFSRQEGSWRIKRRVTRALGREEATSLLRGGKP